MVISVILLFVWSAYSIMRSRQKAKQKGLLFYSELAPHMDQYELSKNSTQFPILSGVYKGYEVKIVPETDSLVLRQMPRLYVRIYINIPNAVLFRLRKLGIETQSNHLFKPSIFEKSHSDIRLNDQEYRLFLGDNDYPLNIEDSLAQLFPASNKCAELLFQKDFIRLTILLTKSNLSAYVMTRSVDYNNLIFSEEFFQTHFQAILELHKVLNQISASR